MFSKICILQQAHEKHQILFASAEIISIVQTKINSAQLVNIKFVKIVNYVRYINTSFLQRRRYFAENSSVSISEILLILNSLILDNITESPTMDNVHSTVRCWYFFFATYLYCRYFSVRKCCSNKDTYNSDSNRMTAQRYLRMHFLQDPCTIKKVAGQKISYLCSRRR